MIYYRPSEIFRSGGLKKITAGCAVIFSVKLNKLDNRFFGIIALAGA